MKIGNVILILLLSLILLFSCGREQSNIVDGNLSEEDILKVRELIEFMNDTSEEDKTRVNELIEFMNEYKVFSKKMVDTMNNMADKILINKADIEDIKKRLQALEQEGER
jgi:uncharacterized membrane protein YvbJ